MPSLTTWSTLKRGEERANAVWGTDGKVDVCMTHVFVLCRYTPLDYALLGGHSEVTQFMLEHGALSIAAIQDIAAASIQAVYKGYTVRKAFRERKQLLMRHEQLRKDAAKWETSSYINTIQTHAYTYIFVCPDIYRATQPLIPVSVFIISLRCRLLAYIETVTLAPYLSSFLSCLHTYTSSSCPSLQVCSLFVICLPVSPLFSLTQRVWNGNLF